MSFTRNIIGLCTLLLAVTAIVAPHSTQASVNDFTVNAFDADYYLTRDQQQHSRLKVTEKITVIFPDIDQNHGIERAIPERYDGRTLHLRIDSVTDLTGQALPYKTRIVTKCFVSVIRTGMCMDNRRMSSPMKYAT